MKSTRQKSISNLLTAVTYKLVVIAVGLILPKLFITNYGSELNGLRDSVRQIFTYIALIEAGVGASTLQSLYKPVAAQDNEKANAFLSAASKYYNKIGVIYFVALTILGFVYALSITVDSATKLEVFIYFLVSGSLTGINFFYVAKLKLLISAKGDLYIVSTISMVTYVVSSIAKIACICCGIHFIIVEVAYFLVNAVATTVYFLFAKKKYPWLSFNVKPDYECVKQKGAVMTHRIASIVFQNTDIILLSFFCNLEVVSVYSMYKMVVDMVTSIVTEMGNSVTFVLGQRFNSEGEDKRNYCALIDMFNVYYSAVAFAVYTAMYIMILPFLRIYTNGMDINYIFPILPVLYIIMELLVVGRDAMMRTIEVAGHFKKTQKSAVIEAVINLLASVIFVLIGKKYVGNIGGICGVILGTIIALIYRTVDINIYANRYILKRGAFKSFFVMLTNAALFSLVAIVLNMVSFTITGYLELVLYGMLVIFVVLMVFVVVQSAMNPKEYGAAKAYIQQKLISLKLTKKK